MELDCTIVCPDCGRGFADANALGNHLRATHDNPGWHKTKAGRKAALRAERGALPPQQEQT